MEAGVDTGYTEITSLPIELYELREFTDGLYLTADKEAKLVKLLEAVNRKSATDATLYCVKLAQRAKIASEVEEHYDRILANVAMLAQQHLDGAYMQMYETIRKQVCERVYRLYVSFLRRTSQVVDASNTFLKRINERHPS